ncbi:MAG: hypothetical protein IJ944_04455 [Clostridia bacterium]|nr:hypothetical protein [Clostridia bacterium]
MLKKFLSVLMIVCVVGMSLPITTLTTFAAADTSHIKYEYIGVERDSEAFALCDSPTGFVAKTGDVLSVDRQNKVGGIACVDYKISANDQNLIKMEYSREMPVNAKRYTHIEMDIYLDNVDFIGDLETARLVLGSKGKSGVAEMSFEFFSGLNIGWNHVKIAIADAISTSADFDITHINYLLIEGNTLNIFTTTLNIKLDDVYFTNGNGGSVANLPVNMGENFLGYVISNNGYGDIDRSNKVAGNGAVKCYAGKISQGRASCSYLPADPIDASGLTHLELDVYIPDATLLSRITESQFEIGSAEVANVEEISFNIKSSLKAGWSHIKLPLSEGVLSSTNGKEFDITHVNYLNFYAILSSGSSITFQIAFDNIQFTDGNGVTVYLPKGGNYKRGGAYVSDSIPNFGDLDDDEEITANDALLALQGSVDSIDLTNAQLIKVDVDNNNQITAFDALKILQRSVGLVDKFVAEELLSDYASAPTELGFTKPSLVHTKYYTNQAVVAEVDVTAFGAYGDGEHDDYLAFQTAIDEVGTRGGGSVFVPVGTYKISHALHIPNGVTLLGDNPIINENGTGKVEGTVLYAYSGRNLEDGENFIQLELGAGVHNLSIYYPEQDPNNIVPYSYTIKQTGHYGRSVNNVNFVNSYNGIQMSTTTNALQNIVNISGTILNIGINLDRNVDICRMEGIYFSPKYWLNSGLATFDATAEQNVRDYVKNNATGFYFQQIDWVYLSDVYAEGMHIGANLVRNPATGAPNGQFYNFNTTDCYIGINCEYINGIGMIFTKGTLHAEYPFVTEQAVANTVCINSMDLITTGSYALKCEGSGDITLDRCTITSASDTPSGTAISLTNGSFTATNTTIENFETDIQLTGEAKASMIVNVNTEGNVKVDAEESLLKQVWDEEYVTPEYNEMDYRQQLITRPATDNFINFAEYEYSGSTSSGVAGKLQAAIDELYALGGGMVYVPAGKYTLEKNIVVKSGVEIRGASTNPHHNHVKTTIFYSEFGKFKVGENDKAEKAIALFTLESKSGLSGFKIARANQFANNTFVPYTYSIRGRGFGIYVNNVSDLNPSYGIDLETYKCDGHVINGFDSAPLDIGITIGNGSAKGVIKNCHLICHMYYDGSYVGLQNWTLANDLVIYQKANLRAFVIKDTKDQLLFNNFAFGTYNGIVIDEGADGFVLTHGVDSSNVPMWVTGSSKGGKVDMVNTQLATLGTLTDYYHVEVEESFDGVLNCVQTNMWGDPVRGIDVRGGNVTFTQGTIVASGDFGVRVFGDTVFQMSGVHKRRTTGGYYDILVNNDTSSIVYFANRYPNGKVRPRVTAKYVKSTDF